MLFCPFLVYGNFMSSKESTPQVSKSNALIRSSYRMSAFEQRIILSCISQIRQDEAVTDETLYKVTADDIAHLCDSGSGNIYENMKEAALRLKRREVWINEYPNGEGKRPNILITGWVQAIRYLENEGSLELRFSKDILPYVNQLSKEFTRFALSDIAKMQSGHAIRMYELIMQWRNSKTQSFEIEINEFRRQLHIEGQYPAIKDLKKRVIDKSIEQINEYSPFEISYEQRKTGRRISHLIFSIKKKRATRSRIKSASTPKANRSESDRNSARALIEQIKMKLDQSENTA